MRGILSSVWRGWKRCARALGVVNTKILLTSTYFVILSVYSVIGRIFGADLPARRIKTRNSCWREPFELD